MTLAVPVYKKVGSLRKMLTETVCEDLQNIETQYLIENRPKTTYQNWEMSLLLENVMPVIKQKTVNLVGHFTIN